MLKMFKMFPMLEADDGLNLPNTGDEGAEAQEVAEPDVEEGVEEQEVAEPVKTEQDSAFAEMRRQNEELARQLEALRAENAQYNETLGLFFDGDNKIAEAKAYHEQVPVEQVIAEMEAVKQKQEAEQKAAQLEAENNSLKFNQLKALDLAELKEHGVTDIKDVEELGESFFVYRSNGMSASEAYDFIQARKGTPPKPMGKPKVSPPEKETFTRDEVMAMSSEERFKNVDKIRASMTKW